MQLLVDFPHLTNICLSKKPCHFLMTEKELIDNCRKNNPQAQRALYDLYARKMMAVCMRYGRDYDTAQDLMQEGFIKVFTAIDSYTGNGSFEGWVRKIFINTALEYLRRNDILRETVDIDDNEPLQEIDDSTVEQMSADELMELIAELPAGFRTVFNLFVVEGYNHKEIGTMLGITESTSRSQLTRAKKWLQKRLNEL